MSLSSQCSYSVGPLPSTHLGACSFTSEQPSFISLINGF